MAKRPSFQFYPADWRNNAKLGRCTRIARGAWLDIMCVLHDSDEYGVVRWPLADLAHAAHVDLVDAQELVLKDVLKGGDNLPAPYIFRPFHAGKYGDEVVLVETKADEPCWYCSRMVRDEWLRGRRGAGTRFDADNQPNRSPKSTPNTTPTRPVGEPTRPMGERQGDGSTSSSTSTSSEVTSRDAQSQNGFALIPPEEGREKSVRATRWPSGQKVSELWKGDAIVKRTQLNLPAIDVDLVAEQFANYWAAKAGRDATKLDWYKTWINWILKENPRNGHGSHPQKRPAIDQHLAGLASLHSRGRPDEDPD